MLGHSVEPTGGDPELPYVRVEHETVQKPPEEVKG
jgi:hypothetical protein